MPLNNILFGFQKYEHECQRDLLAEQIPKKSQRLKFEPRYEFFDAVNRDDNDTGSQRLSIRIYS